MTTMNLMYIFLLKIVASTDIPVVVQTSLGPVKGVQAPDGVKSFRGIEYAKIPLRFAPSRAADAWGSDHMYNATAFGPVCHQRITSMSAVPARMAEDCLSLNIWTPPVTDSSDLRVTKRARVMLWIHGGGFTQGSSSEPTYNGSRLAREHGVVVVTFNYRLGVLGLLALPELAKAFGATGGMNFLYDQADGSSMPYGPRSDWQTPVLPDPGAGVGPAPHRGLRGGSGPCHPFRRKWHTHPSRTAHPTPTAPEVRAHSRHASWRRPRWPVASSATSSSRAGLAQGRGVHRMRRRDDRYDPRESIPDPDPCPPRPGCERAQR